jgi:hypothetical protein
MRKRGMYMVSYEPIIHLPKSAGDQAESRRKRIGLKANHPEAKVARVKQLKCGKVHQVIFRKEHGDH